jgi:hypothetical protein
MKEKIERDSLEKTREHQNNVKMRPSFELSCD